MTAERRILLIIGGGIAAYKSLELIRRAKQHGIAVTVVLTEAAEHFVTPLAAAALSGEKVYTQLFDLTDETEMGHIELSRAADLLVVAPATANLMARMAHGIADDLASTALLATDKPVLIAPAMNVRMWQHAATRRNLAALRGDGIEVIGPEEGDMACGEFGPGRMAEPEAILDAILARLGAGADVALGALAGRKVLVTAGPTHEPIDPVRYIANRSSGRQGYAIAAAAAAMGADTVLVSGPVAIDPPAGARLVRVETAREMLEACQRELPADIAVFAAAVADWRVEASQHKLKKAGGAAASLALSENPDILETVARHPTDRPLIVVGFAAETQDVVANAQKKLVAKGCDLIVANDVGAKSKVMGGASNTVHLVSAGGVESWPERPKQEVAHRLMMRLAKRLDQRAAAAE